MATAISVANFKAALGESYDALAADDLASAKKWAALAEIQFAGLESSQSGDGESFSRRESLKAVWSAIEVVKASVEDGGTWEFRSQAVI